MILDGDADANAETSTVQQKLLTNEPTNDSTYSDQDQDEEDHVQRVHVIVLVHGWLGCPQDLGYMHHALEAQATRMVQQQQHSSKEEPFYVYTCVANSGRTNDGIVAGADRIAEEINEYLQGIQDQNKGVSEITLTILGYSLGGLYSRYALPKIIPSATTTTTEQSNPQKAKIVPKVFCTVATPHLGSGGRQNWFQFPAYMDPWFGVITNTARDLFHLTPHIKDTITDPYWIEPLLRFEKRIAYANTYSMDFMVPTSTAAFLSEKSNSEHFHQSSPSSSMQSLDPENEHTQHPSNDNPSVALVVETLAQHELLRKPQTMQELDMAQRLDAMGWTKVFVDFTNGYRIPPEKSYSSSDLYSEFGHSKKWMFLPNGHDLVVGNSKNVLHSFATRRGRPVVDHLAQDLVQDIVTLDAVSVGRPNNNSSEEAIATDSEEAVADTTCKVWD